MIELGKELGLSPVKCEHREGTESIKQIHYKVNDILFGLSGKLLFKKDAELAFSKLCEYGKELKELKVPEKANAKKSELLTALRKVCTVLRKYIGEVCITEEDIPTIQKSINWTIHKYIQAKEEDKLDTMTVVGMLAGNKELWLNIEPFLDKLRIASFQKMQRELINTLQSEFRIGED